VPLRTARPPRRRVDGVLLLDKPSGISSNAALQRARRALNAAKAGHTGTLDPLASGLLPLCFGEATKFARFLLDADKRYRATVRLGVTTTTQDAEGDVVATMPVDRVDRAAIEAALTAFRGAIRQVPPAHSALKHKGRSHYEYARAGIDVPRAPREVRVASLVLVEWNPPDAMLDVECSKGTYVRALAADIGSALGCGAHLAALRRLATGGFALEDAVGLDAVEAVSAEGRLPPLLPVESLLAGLPRASLEAPAADALRHGRPVERIGAEPGLVRAYDVAGALIGVAEQGADALVAVRLLADAADWPATPPNEETPDGRRA
jgi:tRNA pseudouridine55 synthase